MRIRQRERRSTATHLCAALAWWAAAAPTTWLRLCTLQALLRTRSSRDNARHYSVATELGWMSLMRHGPRGHVRGGMIMACQRSAGLGGRGGGRGGLGLSSFDSDGLGGRGGGRGGLGLSSFDSDGLGGRGGGRGGLGLSSFDSDGLGGRGGGRGGLGLSSFDSDGLGGRGGGRGGLGLSSFDSDGLGGRGGGRGGLGLSSFDSDGLGGRGGGRGGLGLSSFDSDGLGGRGGGRGGLGLSSFDSDGLGGRGGGRGGFGGSAPPSFWFSFWLWLSVRLRCGSGVAAVRSAGRATEATGGGGAVAGCCTHAHARTPPALWPGAEHNGAAIGVGRHRAARGRRRSGRQALHSPRGRPCDRRRHEQHNEQSPHGRPRGGAGPWRTSPAGTGRDRWLRTGLGGATAGSSAREGGL